MDVLTTIFYFVITIGILVFIHEFGHFAAAKLTGMRVDRFSIGFPPRAFGKQIGDTDYCVSWIPIGGYVKIAGMIDESFDTEFTQREPQPWEFRAKPLWARVFVISAGVIMNVLLAVAIFWGINYANGKLLRETTEIGSVVPGSAAQAAGLQAGDRILFVNGQPVSHWDEIHTRIYFDNIGEKVTLDLLRDGERLSVSMRELEISSYAVDHFGIYPANTAPVVLSVEPGKPAQQLGLMPNDILVALNDIAVFNQEQVIKIIEAHANRELKVTWNRDGARFDGVTRPTTEGKIGIGIGSRYTGPVRHIQYSFFGAFPEGLKDIARSLDLFYKSMVQLITGKRTFSESFGGPIKIAQIATQSAEIGITSFLVFMALLSMSLAIINIVPFPALDGGHLMLLLVEGVLRREIPHRVKLAIQQAGFILLLAFMAFVIYNDIVNF